MFQSLFLVDFITLSSFFSQEKSSLIFFPLKVSPSPRQLKFVKAEANRRTRSYQRSKSLPNMQNPFRHILFLSYMGRRYIQTSLNARRKVHKENARKIKSSLSFTRESKLRWMKSKFHIHIFAWLIHLTQHQNNWATPFISVHWGRSDCMLISSFVDCTRERAVVTCHVKRHKRLEVARFITHGWSVIKGVYELYCE